VSHFIYDYTECHDAECRILFMISLNVIMQNVIMQNVIMQNVIMQNVIKLSVVLMSIVVPNVHLKVSLYVQQKLSNILVLCDFIFPIQFKITLVN
jgi:hypothetical protein